MKIGKNISFKELKLQIKIIDLLQKIKNSHFNLKIRGKNIKIQQFARV